MPKQNVDKTLLANTYYHVYNKGLNKKALFKDKEDFVFFIDLLKRYLSEGNYTDKYARFYPSYRGELEIISFNLQPKYFHLLLLQTDNKHAMSALMRSLANSYTSYYNKKYRKHGPLFDGTYKATSIDNQEFLAQISRHIILVDDKYSKWPYSSLPYYLGQKHADWLNAKYMHEVLDKSPSSYLAFLADKDGYKSSLKYINGILADR
jgi:hypothetical protein